MLHSPTSAAAGCPLQHAAHAAKGGPSARHPDQSFISNVIVITVAITIITTTIATPMIIMIIINITTTITLTIIYYYYWRRRDSTRGILSGRTEGGVS